MAQASAPTSVRHVCNLSPWSPFWSQPSRLSDCTLVGVSEVGNEHWSECVSTMDAPTTTDTNSRARVLICGLRGSTVPAAVAAAWLMGCEGLSVSSATTQVLGAISACETMLKAAPNNNFIQQLRTLEQVTHG